MKKEIKKSRKDSRFDHLVEFTKMINSMVVLDGMSRGYIILQYQTAISRLTGLKITNKVYADMTREDLFKEYDDMEKQFKMLNIFSDAFYRAISIQWNYMLNTFNPNASWYKD